MASFLDKLKIKTAIDDRTKLDLGCDHISTANWMQYNVAYSKELVPRESIKVSMEMFTRMLPLTRPTFGRAHINNRAFFVPYRTIWDGWNDFITDTLHFDSSNNPAIGTTVPYIEEDDFCQLFINSSYSTEIIADAGGNIAAYDFTCRDANGVGHYYKLTNNGRQAMKILQSLGYAWDWNLDKVTFEKFSALPLLSVAKVYCDWYWPTQYLNHTSYTNVYKLLSMHNANGFVVNVTSLGYIFTLINYVMYDSDYFTAAWNNPNSPNAGSYSNFEIPDISKFE